MDFELTEEQRIIQDMAYRFAVNEMAPVAQEHDREEKFAREIWKKGCEAGLVGSTIPEEYGGPGFGFLEQALITEQLSRVDLGLCLCIVAAIFGSEHILFFGTEEQKKKYLPPLCSGKAISAGAFTEPDAGTDVAAGRTRAVKDGGDYVINGNKMFITNGTVCNFMAVFCVTNPEAEARHSRHSIVLVEADRPGVTVNKITGKLGVRASDTTEIAFEDVRVPQENLVGEEGRGFYQLMEFFDATRTMVAAQGVGVAQGALDLTVKYVQERKTFGRPLASNQGLQFQLAEMATRIEMARNTTYKAAWMVDQGLPTSKESCMAKLHSSNTYMDVARDGMQIMAGYGFTMEYDMQRHYRDAKLSEFGGGTSELMHLLIAGEMGV